MELHIPKADLNGWAWNPELDGKSPTLKFTEASDGEVLVLDLTDEGAWDAVLLLLEQIRSGHRGHVEGQERIIEALTLAASGQPAPPEALSP